MKQNPLNMMPNNVLIQNMKKIYMCIGWEDLYCLKILYLKENI